MTRAKVYLVIQSLLAVLLVILLSVAAVRIFREGSARKAQNPGEIIYAPEEVSAKFAPIAPLFFAALQVPALCSASKTKMRKSR